MENRTKLKLLRWSLIAAPFLAPWLLLLVDELYHKGKGLGWFYTLCVIFLYSILFASPIALYIWEIVSVVRCKWKSDALYELLLFHVVKLPIFLVAWVVHMIVFLRICLSVSRLEGVQ